jgi:hypothetical protein
VAAARIEIPVGTGAFRRLRIYNVVMGIFHAAQGGAVLALANDFAVPVTGSFLQGPPGTPPAEPTTLFRLSLGWGVAVFLFLSAAAHFTAVAPGVSDWYRHNLERGRNYLRWIEYSLSASLMVVLIAMLTGISDSAALLAIFGVNAAMILFGLVQEHYEQTGGSMLPFWLGSLVGAVPWLAVGVYLWAPGSVAEPPGFVYAIFFSLFVFFNCFALNMWLQYRQIGRWRSYLYGESVYILLSLTAKSALAWQVFASTLAG